VGDDAVFRELGEKFRYPNKKKTGERILLLPNSGWIITIFSVFGLRLQTGF
jgi:hypothetical protein